MSTKAKTVTPEVTNNGAEAQEKKKAENGSWLWALKWTMWILLSPILIPLYFLPKGIWWVVKKGGKRILWDEFGSYIVGTIARNEDGTVKYVRFVNYDDMVHFHYCIWGSLITGGLAYITGANAIVAPLLILTPIFCFVIVKYDFPFDKIWKPALLAAILVPLADYGLYKGTELLTTSTFPWLEEHLPWLGFTAANAGGYEIVWFVNWAFERFGFQASPGLHFFAALAWTLFFLGTVAAAWVNSRFELDRRELYRRKLFKSAGRRPVYMRRMTVVVKDLFETIPFGFASLSIEFAKRPVVLRNIMGLAWGSWLGHAVQEVINYSQTADSSKTKSQAASGEDNAELVRTFEQEEDDLENDHDDHDELGDEEVDHDIEADDFDDEDEDGFDDVEADL